MNFTYGNFWPLFILGIVSICFLLFRQRRGGDLFIRKYWGLKPSRLRELSFILSLLGMSILLLSLLDIRGEGKKLKASISQKKTVVLLDASASMLAEDIRPNRFERGVFLARHFIRKAIGHEVSIILFSDIHRKVVPFTSDLDLLDARLEALAKTELSRGGTGLSLALQESSNYLRDHDGKISGNILLFTDGEDNQSFVDLRIPPDVNVAVVGIGTKRGAKIPLKSSRGDFRGYMRFGGKEVESKLEEKTIQKIGENIKNFKYWIVNSYSLPTEAVLNYFQSQREAKKREGEMIIRPVLYPWIVIPGVFLWILGLLLSRGRQFVSLGMILLLTSGSLYGSDSEKDGERELLKKIRKVQRGDASREEKLDLAEKLLRGKQAENAKILYGENRERLSEKNKKTHTNWAMSSLGEADKNWGLKKLRDIENLEKDLDKPDSDFLKHIRKMRYWALKREKKEQEDQKNKKESKDNKKDNQKNNKKDNQPQDNEKKQSEQDKNQEKGSSQEKKQDSPSKKEQSDKKKNKDDSDRKNKPQQDLGKKEMSAILKQLLSDDKELQKKLLNTRTRKNSRRQLKNW